MIDHFFLIALLAFILTFIDISFGMGFSVMAPILIILGYSPIEVIPVVLFCSTIFGFIGGLFHHAFKNVNFGLKRKSTKIMLIVSIFGIIGVFTGALLTLNLPEEITKYYIAGLIIVLGLIILTKHKKERYSFSWIKTLFFGILAAFNKGIAGGGYGPVLTGGQILSGVRTKKAVGITTLSEGFISLAGVITFIIFGDNKIFNWELILAIAIGGVLSIPLGTFCIKKINPKNVKLLIGISSIILGILVLITTANLA